MFSGFYDDYYPDYYGGDYYEGSGSDYFGGDDTEEDTSDYDDNNGDGDYCLVFFLLNIIFIANKFCFHLY